MVPAGPGWGQCILYYRKVSVEFLLLCGHLELVLRCLHRLGRAAGTNNVKWCGVNEEEERAWASEEERKKAMAAAARGRGVVWKSRIKSIV
jgi:hypothetical protein